MVVEAEVEEPKFAVIDAVREAAKRFQKNYETHTRYAQQSMASARENMDYADEFRAKHEQCVAWLNANAPGWEQA